MAIYAHSTPVSAFQRGLLRGGGVVPCRVLTSAEVVDLIGAETTPGPAAARHDTVTDLTACQGDTPTRPTFPNFGERKIAPNDLRNLAQARALHMRRELRQALDHGFALLDALDLSPRGLDIIDGAIARLDAMDEPGEDLEDEGLAEEEPDDEEGDDLEAVNEDGDPLDHGERDCWRRPRQTRVERTEWPVAMAEREAQRLAVIAAVVTSPNVVRFPGRRANG